MRGKLILIEGTDCSGKATQTNLLIEKLNNDNIKCIRYAFPDYESPTGKIIGGPYLGKNSICECWFPEGAINVSPKISSLYFGADFLYHVDAINKYLNDGYMVVLDRYFYSSFAHQGGKELDPLKRKELYDWLGNLFLDLLELPDPDIKVFLHMPYEVAFILKQSRNELDQHEKSKEHLMNAEQAYIEISNLYNFKTIECGDNGEPRKIENINEELYKYVKEKIK